MQSPAGPTLEAIIRLHDYISFYLVIIFAFVSWFFLNILIDFKENKNTDTATQLLYKEYSYTITSKIVHKGTLEIIWTIIPIFILTAIAIPSFELLYALDVVSEPLISLKCIGNQWYWAYESRYSFNTVEYLKSLVNSEEIFNAQKEKIKFLQANHLISDLTIDSYLLDANELAFGYIRLLETDSFPILPTDCEIRLIITSMDVLHSFAVPALGVKVDAIPGRLNQFGIKVRIPGIYFGQCSELCGAGHGFMPIKLQFAYLQLF